jgi:hypothetical protein
MLSPSIILIPLSVHSNEYPITSPHEPLHMVITAFRGSPSSSVAIEPPFLSILTRKHLADGLDERGTDRCSVNSLLVLVNISLR